MAFCNTCGAQIPDGSATCPICGSVIYEHVNQPQAPAQSQQGGYTPYGQQPAQQQNPYAQPQQNPYAQQGTYQPYGQQSAQPPYQQNPYQQAPYQQNAYQQVPYGAPQITDGYNQAKSARTMGILSIVFAFISPLVCWILSAIGSNKAKQAIQIANMSGDQQLLAQSESAKKLCTVGMIIGIVSVVLGVILVSSGALDSLAMLPF